MFKLVLLRHGESTWNQENRFTGWTDVDLSEKGKIEAENAGNLIRANSWLPEYAYTSMLKRAIKTLNVCLEKTDRHWIPVEKSWRLNERHYGALQGLNKSETAAKYGEEQVHIWRRSFDVLPPLLDLSDNRHPKNDSRYSSKESQPAGEALANTVDRMLPFWNSSIAPKIRTGSNVLVVAHGNSLRALVMHLDKLTPQQIMEVNIPTGIPLIYELDELLLPIRKYYLGDQSLAEEAAKAVAKQGKN